MTVVIKYHVVVPGRPMHNSKYWTHLTIYNKICFNRKPNSRLLKLGIEIGDTIGTQEPLPLRSLYL